MKPKAFNKQEVVRTLQEQVRNLEVARRGETQQVSSGIEPLDRILPGRGFQRGTLIEWFGATSGSGASSLALLTAREASRGGRALVVVDPQRKFYPPAAAAWGINLQSVVVICPETRKDSEWALDQALACSGVGAVMAWPEKLDTRTFRRLQLTTETAGTLGLLIRAQTVLNQPSWAEIRLLVEPQRAAYSGDRCFKLELLRCRGAKSGAIIRLAVNDETGSIYETHTLHLAPELAHSTSHRRSSGA